MKLTTLGICFGLLACAPAKAPGTEPGDMTTEEHRAAAEDAETEAAAHEDRADRSEKGPQKVMHEQKATERKAAAGQHEEAAEESEAADEGE